MLETTTELAVVENFFTAFLLGHRFGREGDVDV